MNTHHALHQLHELNTGYLRAVEKSDVAWFDEHLSPDFRCTNPNGTFRNKVGFLEQAARPAGVFGLVGHYVEIRLLGDSAIIHAATSYHLLDGSIGYGRYTDVWCSVGGRWLAIAAHVSRV